MRRAAALAGIVATVAVGCGDSGPSTTDPFPAASVIQISGRVCGTDARGSGVLIDEGLVLTSAHVLAGTTGDIAAGRPGLSPVAATLVGFDPERDLALLAAPRLTGTPAAIGAAQQGTVGQIGTVNNAGELEFLGFTVDRFITANSGDIYDEGQVSRDALQLRATTLPGDSGGALFDSSGFVVGIVFAQSRELDAVAYALAPGEITAFLDAVDPSTEVAAGRCP